VDKPTKGICYVRYASIHPVNAQIAGAAGVDHRVKPGDERIHQLKN
jgi:hypothetical protein